MFTGMTHTDGLRPTVTRRRALQLAGAAAGVLGAGVAGLPWAAPAWAGPAVAAPATGFGLFEDLQYLTGTALTDRLDEFVRLGVGWARFQLIWANVQRQSPGSFDWGPIDALVAALVARNIRPLAVLDTSPPWASRAPGCAEDTCAPTDPAQFAAFAKTAAARYATRVAAWEIWNEQNTDSFFRPGPDVAGYTALLRAVYPAIKSADRNATVLTGGVAPAATRVDGATISPTDFLQGIYDHGGAGFFDAVGWHPYCYPAMTWRPCATAKSATSSSSDSRSCRYPAGTPHSTKVPPPGDRVVDAARPGSASANASATTTRSRKSSGSKAVPPQYTSSEEHPSTDSTFAAFPLAMFRLGNSTEVTAEMCPPHCTQSCMRQRRLCSR